MKETLTAQEYKLLHRFETLGERLKGLNAKEAGKLINEFAGWTGINREYVVPIYTICAMVSKQLKNDDK